MIFKPYSAYLVRHLDRDAMDIPISQADEARLLAQLPSGRSTLMVLKDGVYSEEVRVGNRAGTIYLAGRGLGETVPRKFPRGSALCFEVTVSVVLALIARRRGRGPEPGWTPGPPSVWAAVSGAASVGTAWAASVMFNGSGPVEVEVKALPPWAEVRTGNGYAAFAGTPDEAGTWPVLVTASNREGTLIWETEVTAS